MGLAPFLRMSIAGTDMMPLGRDLIARAEQCPDDTSAMMDLATYLHCIGQADLGLGIQQQALQQQHIYFMSADRQPARLRLLALVAAGNLSCNMPVDCLLENSDIDLTLFYVSARSLAHTPLPEHDILLVAIGESDANQVLLKMLSPLLENWPKPVLNSPDDILKLARNAASAQLQGIPGLLMPPTLRASRSDLVNTCSAVAQMLDEHGYPVIIRPVDSHAGKRLQKIEQAHALSAYLAHNDDEDFFISPYIDYRSEDGQFRKYRIALIDGVPFACHMALSSDWMVHYVNAGMYLDAAKRDEEAAFMTHFDQFAQRHAVALRSIHQRTQLDYVCLDCAETRDGQLFIFEVDHAMVVHALDTLELFPYKQIHMQKVLTAFRTLLIDKTGLAGLQGDARD
jgi:Glutathione synthase/Ribosomal protein S6 modification enzyme (glutaminyl transferase)